MSTESLLSNVKFRKMLLESCFLVVEESHCIKTFGDNFRLAFAEIGILRILTHSPNLIIN